MQVIPGMENVYKFSKKYDFCNRRRSPILVQFLFKANLICFSFDGIKNITSGEGGAVVLMI